MIQHARDVLFIPNHGTDVSQGNADFQAENARKFETAQKQALALECVLENSKWLTAEEVGAGGRFSPSNLDFYRLAIWVPPI